MQSLLWYSSALIATGIFLWNLAKRFYPWLFEDIRYLRRMHGMLRLVHDYEALGTRPCDILLNHARKNPHHPLILHEEEKWSYDEMDKWSNRCARALRSIGIAAGDAIGILLLNEPAFCAIWMGGNRTGVIVSFLNSNLRSKSLLHCIDVSNVKALIVGKDEPLIKAVEQIEKELKERNIKIYVYGPTTEKFDSFSSIVDDQPSEDTPVGWGMGVPFQEAICYIFTSGTTGLPKAVRVNNYKALAGACLLSLTDPTKDDVVYTAMPMYHSAASLIGFVGTLKAGCTIVLRKKFSASQFWPDCRKYGVTIAQYVGELLRYVCNLPATAEDRNHKLRAVLGNGLRPDVWRVLLDRYGPHIHVFEFYAATEGNVLFMNFHNKFGCLGTFSPLLRILTNGRLVKYDYETEEMITDKNGRAIKCGYDEPGLLISKITKDFKISKYKGKDSLTEKKILHDVFKDGDAYFNTGDLLKYDREHRIYFCDRIGDTFRWKGENVSTNEVGDTISQADGIEEANVYGVQIPGKDGRAGMAALVLSEEKVDFRALYSHICDALPSYARPLFLRILPEMEVTGTLKQRKVNLQRQGYSLDNVGQDKVYFIDNQQRTYVSLTRELQEKIENGSVRI